MGKTKVVLKNYVVLKDHEGNYIHWSTSYYQDYVMKAIRKGGTPTYTVVAHFNGDEDLIKQFASAQFKEERCDAMGHYGGEKPEGICPKCRKPWEDERQKEEEWPKDQPDIPDNKVFINGEWKSPESGEQEPEAARHHLSPVEKSDWEYQAKALSAIKKGLEVSLKESMGKCEMLSKLAKVWEERYCDSIKYRNL